MGSRAHVRGLVRAGILDGDEASAVLGALDQVEQELASGAFVFEPSDEDIHTAVERRVTEVAGPAGAKLHTGRSRNDQVATDLRLFTKRELAAVAERVLELQGTLLARAEEAGDEYLPGYTHLQRAQPVTAGPPPARPRLGAGPRRRPPAGRSSAARRVTARERARWRARRSISTPSGWPPTSASPGPSTTRSTRSATATSWPSRSSP